MSGSQCLWMWSINVKNFCDTYVYPVMVTTRSHTTTTTTTTHIKDRLITHEDPYHLHKTLGITCLLNFAYRYLYHLPIYGSLGYEEINAFNTMTMVAHMMLSSSSLIFNVLRLRLPKKPLLIYEEYRLHTILFTLRGCGPYLYEAVVRSAGRPDLGLAQILATSPYIPFLATMCLHLAVDWVTRVHGTPGLTTVRVANKSTRLSTTLFRRSFSFYQVIAAASSIASTDIQYLNMGYNTLIAIQSSTFLMTLVRKNIIRPYTHLAIYGGCLVASTGYIFLWNDWQLLAVSAAVFAGRMCGISKYVLWHGVNGYYHLGGMLPPTTP